MRKIFHLPFIIFHLKKFQRTKPYTLNPIPFQGGFTLVEMLVYMGILSVMLVILMQIFFSLLDATLDSQATSTLEQDSRYILTRLTYDIQKAQSVTTPSPLGQSSTSLQIVVDGINYSYTLLNGNLQLTNNDGTNVLNGFDSTVSNPVFTVRGNVNGKPSVSIQFTLQSKTLRSTMNATKIVQTTVALR